MRQIEYSIIICTNSCKKEELQRMNHLLVQISEQITEMWEVIIIFNGVMFHQFIEAQKKLNTSSIKSLQLYHIAKPGLSFARNYGIEVSIGKYLFFLDDDNHIEKGYFDNLLTAMEEYCPEAIGGIVVFDSNIIIPKWLTLDYTRLLVSRSIPNEICIVNADNYIVGATMAFPRSTFIKHGAFDCSLGRVGKKLLSGEDSEFMQRLNPSKVYIQPKARVKFQNFHNRFTAYFFIRRYFWQGITDAKIYHKIGKIAYDYDELAFSCSFIRVLLNAVQKFDFLLFICKLIRWITFHYYSKMFNKRY